MREVDESQEIHALGPAISKFKRKLKPSKTARAQEEKRLQKVAVTRRVRRTGRTAQFNFRCKDGLKQSIQEAAAEAEMSVAEWMETALLGVLQKPAQTNGKSKNA